MAAYVPAAPGSDNAQVLRVRRRWARLETIGAPLPLVRRGKAPGPPRKLRIGYVSAFLAWRNWMKPVWGVLDAHDRRAFEIHLFLDRGLPERRHGYVPKKSDRVHAIGHLSNEAAAERIAAAEIDILVDLNAFSFSGRLGIFLRRAAPIQVGWFNTFATSGTGAFDFAIADKAALPAREERFYTEKILRVAGSYLAFTVSYRTPRVVASPVARSGRFTFGCLAPQYKINPKVTAAFSEILRAVPEARLLLRNTCLGDEGNRSTICARFLRNGVSSNQLIFEGPAGHYAFLKTYDRIDVALDTFPYSGGVTTMEALWQGVPVLTFSGDRWASRTSSSLLFAAGLGEWVRPSLKSYVRQAIRLASSPEDVAQLSLLRAGMRTRLLASPACAVKDLCRQLEAHYSAMAKTRSA
jgi:protein O-GlcNAc transferase